MYKTLTTDLILHITINTSAMTDKPKEQVETAPDPDEDDLDDLDGTST